MKFLLFVNFEIRTRYLNKFIWNTIERACWLCIVDKARSPSSWVELIDNDLSVSRVVSFTLSAQWHQISDYNRNCKRIHKKRTKLVMQSYWNVIHKLNGIRAKTDRWHWKAIFWWYDENEIFNLRQIEMSSISAWRGKKNKTKQKAIHLLCSSSFFTSRC